MLNLFYQILHSCKASYSFTTIMLYPEYIQKRDSLFQRWESSFDFDYEVFTKDGIVAANDDQFAYWQDAQVKILFLLKESYGGFHPGEKEAIGRKFGLNVARWRHAIIEVLGNKNPSPSMPDTNALERNLGIAFVEVKKADQDKLRSQDDEIVFHAKRDKEFLREQIDLINPQIIVGCGTTESYDEIYGESMIKLCGEAREENKEKLSAVIWLHRTRLFVDFYHPSCTKPPEALYLLLARLLVKAASSTDYLAKL